jgi:hypothetical protein
MNLPLSSYISSLISEACRQTFKEYQKVDKPCGFFCSIGCYATKDDRSCCSRLSIICLIGSDKYYKPRSKICINSACFWHDKQIAEKMVIAPLTLCKLEVNSCPFEK